MWWYTVFALVDWAVNPELRRLYEWKFGFSVLSVLAILPLVSLIPHIWSLTFGGGWQRLPRILAIAAWVYLGGFSCALVVSAISGNLVAGTYTFVSFVFPIAIGLWVAADPAPFGIAFTRLTRTLFGLTTFMCVYGVIQYALAPAWDVSWLQTVIAQGATAFGNPVPFKIRIWSTLNSPGPFAFFIAMMLLLALPQLSIRRPLLLLQIPIWLAAFGLTLVRTGWLMFAVGAGVYAIFTARRATFFGTFAVIATVFAGVITILPVITGNDSLITSLSSRFSTLSALDQDESAGAREQLYSQAGTLISSAPFGQGLGVLGTSTKLSASEVTSNFDSGFLSRAVEMGIPGFILYIIPLLLLVVGAVRLWITGRGNSDAMATSLAAMALGQTAAITGQQIAGEATGVVSLLYWLIMCLTIRAQPDAESERPMVPAASGLAYT